MTLVNPKLGLPDLAFPPEAQRWPPVFPPVCAEAWGDDRYGLWIDVVIGGPLQRFRWIEPGEFLMGSPEGEVGRQIREGPRHVVCLTDGFWLAETACSQAVWLSVMGSNPSDFKKDLQNPVEQVSWDDVQVFLGEVGKCFPGVKADLPTEAEWEYACRAGSETAFSWGEGINPWQAKYDSRIGYAKGPMGMSQEETVPVRTYAPNAWGLYQMHGNVWEWCADGLREYDGELQVDPRGPAGDGDWRVLRGGSWIAFPHYLRAAHRDGWRRDWRSHGRGFRLLLRSPSSPEGGSERPQEAVATRDA